MTVQPYGRVRTKAPTPPARRISPWLTRSLDKTGAFDSIEVWLDLDDTGGYDQQVAAYLTPAPVTVRYGRANEFEEISPAVCQFELFNDDGRFMPDHAGSPYFPNWREGREVFVALKRGAATYMRFQGRIVSIEPRFATGSTAGSTVVVSAVDDLGTLANFPMPSSWLNGARWLASVGGGRWDGFVMTGDGVSTGAFDNVTDSPGTKATATVLAATNDRGTLSFGSADGLSMDGSVTFNPDSSNDGSIVVVKVGSQMRQLQFWVRFPSDIQISAGLPNLDVITFRDAQSNPLGFLRLANNAGQQDLNYYNAANTFVGTLAFGCSENRWVRCTLLADSGNNAVTDAFYDGGGLVGGGSLNNLPLDLRAVSTFNFGGNGLLVPKMELAGIVLMHQISGGSVLVELGLTAGYPSIPRTVIERIAWLQQATPPGAQVFAFDNLLPSFSRVVATGNWHGRSGFEVVAELARSIGGIVWAIPRTSLLTSVAIIVPPEVLYPPHPYLTLDAEGDLSGTVTLRRGVDSSPTRATVSFPGGKVTVIDTAAEAAVAGQARAKSIETVCIDADDAAGVGDAILQRSAAGLRIDRLTIDLETSVNNPVAALFTGARFGAGTSVMGGLFPTQRLRILLPESHFDGGYRDVHVQGWTEIYDPVGGCRIECDLSPALPEVVPPLEVASWSAVFVDGPDRAGTIPTPRPSGVAAGDLLLAVHWGDNDGSLATMTAPTGWTQQASNTAAGSGFAKVWSKVATAAEPGSYTFGIDTDTMGHVTILRVVGADTADPFLVAPSWASTAAASSSHVAPSVTPSGAGLLVCGWQYVVGPPAQMTWTAPAGMTFAGDDTAPANYMKTIVATKDVAAGATGTQTATSSTASSALGNHRLSFVLRPMPTPPLPGTPELYPLLGF